MSSFGPMKKRKLSTCCYTSNKCKIFVNNTIRLLIPIVVNNANVVIIIKYQIVVNNTSSNHTKINFWTSFLGYRPNGNCVITLLDKFNCVGI